MLKSTILDMIEISKIDTDILTEAFFALAVEFTTFYMDESTDLAIMKSRVLEEALKKC